ncbi:MAG: leucine-rich repeat protein, partial [Prevotellaceae bacterium]|nr:leucine-rich repeat protein [Prevotellaceae bacterium]
VFDNMAIHRLDVNDLQSWCSMSFNSTKANPMTYAKDIYINGANDFDLVLPEDVCAIGNNAFHNCKGLRSLTIKGRVKQIGMNCFADCINLKNVCLSDDIENIGNGVFANCKSLTSVHLPANLSFISDSLFYGCENLTDVTIPLSVKEIRKGAFSGCKSMLKVDLPFICNSIGEKAFEKCTSLTMIKLPYNVTEIGESAFANCEGLTTVKAFWSTAPVVEPTTFTNVNKKCILYVPVGAVPSYYENGWGRFPLIEEGYSVIYLEGNDYGTISCGDASYKGQDKLITLDINADVSLNVEPNDGFFIKELALDGKRIEPEMHNSVIELQNLTDNHVLSVEYKRYVLGDVNNDDYIDVGDVAAIVKHIQRETLIDFIPVAADTNNDDDIDVGDIRGEVNLIYDYAQVSRSHQLRSKQTVTDNIVRLNGSKMDNSCEYMVDVILNDVASVSGFQIQMILPQGVVVPKDNVGKFDVVFDEEKCAGMNIKIFTQINDSCYQILCSASTLEEIVGGGRVCSIKLVNSNLLDIEQHVLVTMPDIRVADKYGNVVRTSLESLTFGDTTGLTNNFTNSTKATRKLLRNGRVLIVDKNDMYDINGVKVK